MPDKYLAHEFYADALAHRLTLAKRRFERIWFFVGAVIFAVTLVSLFWRREQTNGYLTRLEHAFVEQLFNQPNGRVFFFALVGLIFLINIGPTLIYYIRKYWFYPKSSMNLQSYLAVQSKETMKLPRAENDTKTPRAFYVYVGHPVTGKVLPVQVSEEWYMRLEAGHRVHAHYHPSNDNVLYLVNNQ